jgi:hypothetical protein
MGAPPRPGGGPRDAAEEAIVVELPARRLQVAAVLLFAVAILGILATVASHSGYGGIEGLGSLLEEPRADVMGVVKDADGDPVAGATVTVVERGEPVVYQATTGSSGFYLLSGVPTGSVHVQAEAEGRQTVVRHATLERGTYVLDFVSVPGDGTVEEPGGAVPAAGDASAGASLALVAMAVASAAALVGAYECYARRYYSVALVGALLALLSWGWWAGTLLAMVALLLVLPMRTEFRGKRKEAPFPWDEDEPPRVSSAEGVPESRREPGAPTGPSGGRV